MMDAEKDGQLPERWLRTIPRGEEELPEFLMQRAEEFLRRHPQWNSLAPEDVALLFRDLAVFEMWGPAGRYPR